MAFDLQAVRRRAFLTGGRTLQAYADQMMLIAQAWIEADDAGDTHRALRLRRSGLRLEARIAKLTPPGRTRDGMGRLIQA